MQCHARLTEDFKIQQFNKYWELANYDAQTMFIGALVKETLKKREYGRGNRIRQYSRTYSFNNIQICRETFINTLGISTKRVDTALKKLRSSSIVDKRGKKQGGMNKISEDKRQEIINQINQIPKYKSHYRRQENSDTEFLPPEMTLSLMYRKYAEEVQNPVSFATYKRIFYTNFNLKFKTKKRHLQCMR
jgi:hypothetical protein